jgi:hypothetical protein
MSNTNKVIIIINYGLECKCPNCGAREMHPDGKLLLIRGFKVSDKEGRWYSQCLVCAGYYNQGLVYNETAGDPKKGWYHEQS